MPPANSPTETPPNHSPPASSPYFRQLAAISSPVPDLAATLMSHPEDEAHDDNVRFLRTRQQLSRELSSSIARARINRQHTIEADLAMSNLVDEIVEDDTRAQDSIPRLLSRRAPTRRLWERVLMNGDASSTLLDLYSWTPPEELDAQDPGEFRDYTRADGRPGYRSPRRETSLRQDESRQEPSISSLRHGGSTAALLESVRRHPRLPPGSHTSASDNVHSTQDQAPPPRTSRRTYTWQNAAGVVSQARPPVRVSTTSSRAESRYRNSDIRRMYLKDPSFDRLKEAIQYLDRVRFSSSYEESLTKAAVGGFVHLEYFLRNEDDFILNTGSLAAPPESSWLRPGSVFSGFQQAAHHAGLSHRNRAADPVIVNGNESNRISVHTSSGRRYWARNSVDLGDDDSSHLTESKVEQWPVKVTIHDIDWSSMKLMGTMEAHNIPDKSAGNRNTLILTYLEGEIIDFNTHALETKNFNASPEIDSLYWRELEPFNDATPDDLVKNLVSKKWVTEHLSKGWILMRWKERCFVSPSHSRQGLTISGFYYISMRRDNGHIEGMYFDPGSTPFQQLTLEPQSRDRMVFPAYEFR